MRGKLLEARAGKAIHGTATAKIDDGCSLEQKSR